MKNKLYEAPLLVGLDIGSSVIRVTIATVCSTGEIEIIGLGNHISQGVNKGVIVNLEQTTTAIKQAITAAEKHAKCKVHSVYANLSGMNTQSLISQGMVIIKNNEISKLDVKRVLDTAKAISLPTGQKIIHRLPQEFIVDNQNSIIDPIGMYGVRLEAKVHIVTGSITVAENLVKCIRACGLEVDQLILNALAVGEAILTNDEKRLGVCLIDIGRSTTDVAVYIAGCMIKTWTLPIAGQHITHDIAIAFRTSTKDAEALKINHSVAMASKTTNDTLQVPGVGDSPSQILNKQALATVVEARLEELFKIVKNKLQNDNLDNLLISGVVITGSSSKIKNIQMLADRIFKMPTRLGKLINIKGLDDLSDPSYVGCIGLLRYGYQQQFEKAKQAALEKIGWVTRLQKWLQGNL